MPPQIRVYKYPMSLTITAIDHIQITCQPQDEATTLAFYRDILGLPEIEKPEELKSRGGAWFQLGTQQIHIGVDKPCEVSPSKRHICFLVDDLGKAEAYLAAAGFEILPEPVDAFGLRRFFVRDPAGNRVEIGER